MGYRDSNGIWHDEDWSNPANGPGDPGNQTQFSGNTGFVGSYTPGNGQMQPGDLPWNNVQRQSAFNYGATPGGAQSEEARYAGLAAATDARGAPQMNRTQFNADMARQSQDTGAQDYALTQYEGLVNGTTVSPAQQQLAQGRDAGLAQAASAVAGARGGGNALVAAQGAGADAGARLTGAYNSAYGQLRAREAMGAIQGYGDVATQRRAQTLQAQGLTADQANRQAQLELGQHGQNDQRAIAEEGMRQNVFNDQLAARQAGEAANAGVYQQNAQRRQKQQEDVQAQQNAYVQGGASALGSLLSDVRAKKDIAPAGPQVDEALDAMSPYGYRYKQPERHGQGAQVGPMAQDLAATPAGRQAVVPTKEGLALDGAGATKLSLAGIARLNQRVRDIEARDEARARQTAMMEHNNALHHALNAAREGRSDPADDRFLRAENAVPANAPPPPMRINVGGIRQAAPPAGLAAAAPPAPPPQAEAYRGVGTIARRYLGGGLPGLLGGIYSDTRGQ